MTFLLWEIKKIFRDPKTLLAFLSVVIFTGLMCFIFKWEETLGQIIRSCRSFGLDPQLFINGNLFCRLNTMMTFMYVLPISLCIATISQFAAEEHEGYLKTILSGPMSRTWIFIYKFLAVMVFSIFMVALTFLVSYFVGIAVFGRGELIVSGKDILTMLNSLRTIAEREAILRYFLAFLFSILALFPLIGLGVFICMIFPKPMTATSVTLCLFFGTIIFKLMPFQSFEGLSRYFFTSELYFWGDLFQEVIPWKEIVRGGAFLVAYGLSFIILACGIFRVRDIKS